MLSNKAAPRYYSQYLRMIDEGLPVNQFILLELARIEKLVQNPNIYYDPEPVEGFIRYCENETTLTDGSDLEMLFTFKVWAEQILGWYFFEELSVYEPPPNGRGQGRYVRRKIKRRLINKQFLIVSRGAAKSMYGSQLQSYFLNVYTKTTHQITVAPTMKQAEEVLSPIRTSITRARGPLFKFLTEGSLQNTTGSRATRPKLASTKKGIENFLTGSLLEIRPMTINKLQGLRTMLATVDEWLSGDLKEDVIGAIEQGASKLPDYLIVAISSEGTVRNGPGDSIKMELIDILNGDYVAPQVSIWYYRLDDIKEVANPEMWVKANPNLGITVSYETYQRDVDRAESVPSARNDIVAKRFGIPLEGFSYFFTYEETLTHRKRSFWGMPCALGADLSQGDDFCAFTFMFPLPDGKFGVKVRSYITHHTLMSLPPALRAKYDEFIEEGTLHIMDSGPVLDTEEVYEDLDRHITNNDYDVRVMGYDPYNARKFVELYTTQNGPYGVEKVQQGARVESVPLGRIKTWAEKRWLLFDEGLMSFTMGNAVTVEDINGNRKLVKRRREEKIDNVSALIAADVARELHPDAFV